MIRTLRCHLAAWLLGLGFAVMPEHPFKRAAMNAMNRHARMWWAVYRAGV